MARDAAGKFMMTMAGNLPGFEEASRALYASDRARLEELVAPWPPDISVTVLRLFDAVTVSVEAAPYPVEEHLSSPATPPR